MPTSRSVWTAYREFLINYICSVWRKEKTMMAEEKVLKTVASKEVINNKEYNKEVFNDYEFSPVPYEMKNTWQSQTFIWLGVGFCLTAFTLGGQIALGLGFWPTVAAVLIGGVILTIIAALCGAIGVKSGLSSTVSSRFTFGKYGAMVFGVIVALSNMGWFGYQCTFFGNSIVSMFKMVAGIDVNITVSIVIGGLLMMVTAIVGYKGIKMLSQVGVPLLFALVIAGIIKTFARVPAADVFNAVPSATISFATAVSLMIGSFIVGVSIVQDFTRYSKTVKDSTIGVTLGFTLGYPAVVICGAIFASAFQNNDLTDVMINILGFGYIAAFIIIVATWTTNDNNLYQSTLGLTNTFHGQLKLPRWVITAICGVFATFLGAIGMIDWLIPFLSLLCVLIPPIAGAMLADFYILKNSDKYSYDKIDQIPNVRVDTGIGAVAGCLVGLCMNEAPVGFGIPAMVRLSNTLPTALVAMFVSVIVVVIINKIAKK